MKENYLKRKKKDYEKEIRMRAHTRTHTRTHTHTIDSLYPTQSVKLTVLSEIDQFRSEIARMHIGNVSYSIFYCNQNCSYTRSYVAILIILLSNWYIYILKDFENSSPYFCTFLANRICD